MQGSSEASLEIITERKTLHCDNIKSISPRKPLPTHWRPSTTSPTHATIPRIRSQDIIEGPCGVPSVEHMAVRASHSSCDTGRTHKEGPKFMTKEALNTVDANITSPTLRRTPSKINRSPVKIPWNSPNASPKVGNLRQSAGSPEKPSSPRTIHLNTHTAAEHKRAASSIASTGGTSFHTAHGSPVRSPALSQTSFSDYHSDYMQCRLLNFMANNIDGQVIIQDVSPKVSPSRANKGLQTLTSRPRLSVRIPTDSAFSNNPKSASTLGPAASSVETNASQDNSPVTGSAQISRIPLMSMSKGSSARAPTLSSTLKQTKSTQTLRSPKLPKRTTDADRGTISRGTGVRSLRYVRTLDSSGSTPILSNRNSHGNAMTASTSSAKTTTTERAVQANEVDLLTSYLQDIILEAEPQHINNSVATSRTTSTSTVTALRVVDRSTSTDATITFDFRVPKDPSTWA